MEHTHRKGDMLVMMVMKLTVVARNKTRARLQGDEFLRSREAVLDAESCKLGIFSTVLRSNFERIFLYNRIKSRTSKVANAKIGHVREKWKEHREGRCKA
jgi:hypothetical protein